MLTLFIDTRKLNKIGKDSNVVELFIVCTDSYLLAETVRCSSQILMLTYQLCQLYASLIAL